MPNEMGYNIIYAHRALYQTPDMVVKKIRSVMGDMQINFTFDIDALDPSSAPATGTPVPGGPSIGLSKML